MLKFVYDNSSRVGPYLFIYTNKKVYYLTSFTVVRRLNFPLMRSPKESPTAPAGTGAAASAGTTKSTNDANHYQEGTTKDFTKVRLPLQTWMAK